MQYNLEHWGLQIASDGYCSNLKDNVCTVYENRPLICRVEELYDRVEELRGVEPLLASLVDRVKKVVPGNPKLEYFKVANTGCNYLIKRLGLDDKYIININEVYAEVDKKPVMVGKTDKEMRKEERERRRKERWDHRIERIRAVTEKALAVAKKRKWLVFLIGAGMAVYFAISSGSLGGVLDKLKGLFGS